jgi:hypothetical protein
LLVPDQSLAANVATAAIDDVSELELVALQPLHVLSRHSSNAVCRN